MVKYPSRFLCVRFSVSQNCDFYKLWLLYFFLLQILNPPALQSTAAWKHFFLETVHWVQAAVSGRTDLLPALAISYRSKGKKIKWKSRNKRCKFYIYYSFVGISLPFGCSPGVPEAAAPEQWTQWQVSPWGCCSPSEQWWFSCEPFALLIWSMIFLLTHF